MRTDILWYDRDGNYIGTTQNADNRVVDIEQLGMYPIYPNAAYVKVVTRVEGRSRYPGRSIGDLSEGGTR